MRTPHITKNDKNCSSNSGPQNQRDSLAYADQSGAARWLIEKGFGWLKQTGPLRQVKAARLEKVDWLFVFSCARHNLIWLPNSSLNHQECSGSNVPEAAVAGLWG